MIWVFNRVKDSLEEAHCGTSLLDERLKCGKISKKALAPLRAAPCRVRHNIVI
jgi:hypothetical protein